MTWRVRLLLLATAIGVVPPYLFPALRQLEWKSYDQRLADVRPSRGNIAPSLQAVALGLDETTLRQYPDWGASDTKACLDALNKAGAVAIWVEPDLDTSVQSPPAFGGEGLPYRLESDDTLRRVDLMEDGKLSPALRLFAALKKVPESEVRQDGDLVWVAEQAFPRRLSLSFPVHGEQNYLKPAPLGLLKDSRFSASTLAGVRGAGVLLSNQDVQGRNMLDSPAQAVEPSQVEFAALDTLLSGWTLRPLALPLELFLVTASALLLAWMTFYVQSTSLLVVLWLVALGSYHWLTWAAFRQGVWLPDVPVLMSSLTAAAIVAVGQRLRAHRLLQRLLGSDLASQASQGRLSLGGKERQVTILFTNLPAAVKALEKDQPKESIRARNEYNAVTTQIVRRHLGWMLDYQGDAQMAGFGVERWDDEHALHAVRAAVELQAALSKMYPNESIHCGVYSGPAAVGLVGAPGAKALAAIGDTTNVAARLMGAAMKQKVGVLVGSGVYDQCAERLKVEKLPSVALKGKTSNVEVYSVLEAQ